MAFRALASARALRAFEQKYRGHQSGLSEVPQWLRETSYASKWPLSDEELECDDQKFAWENVSQKNEEERAQIYSDLVDRHARENRFLSGLDRGNRQLTGIESASALRKLEVNDNYCGRALERLEYVKSGRTLEQGYMPLRDWPVHVYFAEDNTVSEIISAEISADNLSRNVHFTVGEALTEQTEKAIKDDPLMFYIKSPGGAKILIKLTMELMKEFRLYSMAVYYGNQLCQTRGAQDPHSFRVQSR